MKTRLAITARAIWTTENGYMFLAGNPWRLPTMVERSLWDVLTVREDQADRAAKWRT